MSVEKGLGSLLTGFKMEELLSAPDLPEVRKNAFLSENDTIPHDSNVVVFDGSCKWCQMLVEFASRFDTEGKIVFVGNNHPGLATYREDLNPENYRQDPYFLSPDGRSFKGAEAMKMVFDQLSETLPVWFQRVRTFISIENLYNYFYNKRSECADGTCQRE